QNEAEVERTATQLRRVLEAWLGEGIQAGAGNQLQPVSGPVSGSASNPSWELLGPSPAAIPRVAQRFRWQLLLKSAAGLDLLPLSVLRQHCPKGVSLLVDVDPMQIG
ncbi:MAG: hypothetical protein HC824_20625, partial [Synechococcales cyanobacterium RM1_1_8]|nr:hypothetical protein [Synechococcales cyanobacterium RM1_1_8]